MRERDGGSEQERRGGGERERIVFGNSRNVKQEIFTGHSNVRIVV